MNGEKVKVETTFRNMVEIINMTRTGASAPFIAKKQKIDDRTAYRRIRKLESMGFTFTKEGNFLRKFKLKAVPDWMAEFAKTIIETPQTTQNHDN